MTSDELRILKDVDLNEVTEQSLVDIKDVAINGDLAKTDRMKAYIHDIKNPYCFKCGDVIVKTTFPDNGTLLDKCMERYLKTFVDLD